MTTVAIIIPYYQKRAGVLRRALDSVVQQNVPPDVTVDVLVVDDGSPLPAEGEVAGLALPPAFHLRVIPQPNGGVGAARNTGLQHVGAATDYVAFLDSDDIWQPGYLAHAITTLERGYDFYFCDTQRQGNPRTTFAEGFFERFLASKQAVKIDDTVYELAKESFFDHSLRGRVFRIPAIVYRRAVAPALSFDTSLRIAGEDCLFLFQLLGLCRRFACTTQKLVIFADGVNIYAGKQGWDSPGHLSLYMGQLLAFYRWRENLRLSEKNRRFIDKRIRNVRRLFAFLTVRYFLKYRQRWSDELVSMTRSDRLFWLWYPYYIVLVIIDYGLLGRRDFARLADPTADEQMFDENP